MSRDPGRALHILGAGLAKRFGCSPEAGEEAALDLLCRVDEAGYALPRAVDLRRMVAARAREERDRRIYEARKVSRDLLAVRFELSRSQVYRIIRRLRQQRAA